MKVATVLESSLPISMVRRQRGMISAYRQKRSPKRVAWGGVGTPMLLGCKPALPGAGEGGSC